MTTGRKILILASDPATSFPLGAGLRKNGWIVVSAQDAAMAMNIARQQKPDAVLLSSKLAGGGGVVALKRLRSSVYTTLIPVICIVDAGSPEKHVLVEGGAQETIDPPGDPQTIDAALRRYLARGEAEVQVPRVVLRKPERLKALADSHLLDTPPDERLDRVTRIAAKLLNAQVGRLSLVDGERQFFKSQVKLTGKPITMRQTPITHSICQWVVGGEEELVVGDAREHPVLRTNLAVREHGVVAYAGVPFTLDGTSVLGSFCVVDTKPHVWSREEVATLRDLALVLQAYATAEDDAKTKFRAVGNALIAATNVLLRDHPRCGDAERDGLTAIVEELSGKLIHLAHGAPVPV